MGIRHPNTASTRPVPDQSGSMVPCDHAQMRLTAEDIDRLRLVLELAVLAEHTRRLASRFENLTIRADRDLRTSIDRATPSLSVRGGGACA